MQDELKAAGELPGEKGPEVKVGNWDEAWLVPKLLELFGCPLAGATCKNFGLEIVIRNTVPVDLMITSFLWIYDLKHSIY